MPKDSRAAQTRRNLVVFLLLLAAGGFLVVFRTEVIGVFTPGRPTYDRNLLPSVTVSGAYAARDMHFSPQEIRDLNYAALSNRDIFSGMDLKLDPTSKRTSTHIGASTPLKLSLVFKAADEDAEVCCWERTVARGELVSQVTRTIQRARELFLHYRDRIGKDGRSIKRLYL